MQITKEEAVLHLQQWHKEKRFVDVDFIVPSVNHKHHACCLVKSVGETLTLSDGKNISMHEGTFDLTDAVWEYKELSELSVEIKPDMRDSYDETTPIIACMWPTQEALMLIAHAPMELDWEAYAQGM